MLKRLKIHWQRGRLQRSASGLMSLETGYALYEAVVHDGLVEPGPDTQGTVANWVGELVNDGRLQPGSRAGGSREVPIGVSWSDAQLQSHYCYRLTDGGRADARETRQLRREQDIDRLLTAAVGEDSLAPLPRPARESLAHHLASVRGALERDDPSGAIGAAKELVEAATKIVLLQAGTQPPAGANLGQLYRQALAAAGRPDSAGFTMGRGAASLVDRLAELRNKHGSGHGRSQPPAVEGRDARLAAQIAIGVTVYLLALDT